MRYIPTFTLFALLLVPVAASAQTAAELQAQAQALLAQVQALQAQLGAQGSGTPVAAVSSGGACPQLGVTLKPGSSGDDVFRLQQFLARDPSVYPEALVTGYYGSLTQAAVQRWQVKYNIVSSGTPETTGYGQVGPRTAAAMSLQCSTSSVGGTPTGGTVVGPTVSTPGVMGGFIQVTPISGLAPLNVKVTVTANTAGSCSGGVYQLQWGDGSSVPQIVVPAGTCGTVVQNYAHLYLYGGTYIIKLSAGTHSTSATIVVSGPSAPPAVASQPETFTATPTSGSAPLTVTFSGTVTGADQGWCASGCSSTLEFGDGSTGSVALPTASNGTKTYSLQHTYTTGGTYTAKLHQGGISSTSFVGSPITITVTGNASTYQYSPPAVTPNVGGNPLAVTAQFDLYSSCTGYDLSWGDGSTSVIQNDGGSSCAQNSVTKTFSHTYATKGSYTITLRRGPTLTRTDSVSLVIQ